MDTSARSLPEPDDGGPDDFTGNASIEDRLQRLEKEQRLRAVEKRLADLEQDTDFDDADGEDGAWRVEGEGEKGLRLAIAGVLSKEAVVDAIAEITKAGGQTLKEWTGLKVKELEVHKTISLRTYYVGLVFSSFVLAFLGTLLWYDKISKELAGTLIGSLIGYWYGRNSKEKN